VKVIYSADGPPTIAARIQDLYSVKDALPDRQPAGRCASRCSRQVIVRCR
jgi:hypothetical protein